MAAMAAVFHWTEAPPRVHDEASSDANVYIYMLSARKKFATEMP